MLLLPAGSFCQSNLQAINRYYLFELHYAKEPYKINVLRLAVVPKKNNNLKLNTLKTMLQQKDDISALTPEFFIYNFIPAYPDSYLYPRSDASDGDVEMKVDTFGKDKFYYQYLEMLMNSKKISLADEATYLRNDSMFLKITEVKGKLLLVNYDAGLNVLSHNRRIKEDFKTKGILLPSDSVYADNAKQYYINDVFLPVLQKFVLQGGEDSVGIIASFKIKNKNIRYQKKNFVARKQLKWKNS